MFDFYKEFFLEMQGIKPQKKLSKEREYVGDENKKPILSTKIRIIIWLIGLMYLIVAVLGISVAIKTQTYARLIKYIILSLLDVISMILIMFKNGKIEKVAVALIIAFIIINYSTSFIGG